MYLKTMDLPEEFYKDCIRQDYWNDRSEFSLSRFLDRLDLMEITEPKNELVETLNSDFDLENLLPDKHSANTETAQHQALRT